MMNTIAITIRGLRNGRIGSQINGGLILEAPAATERFSERLARSRRRADHGRQG